MASERNADVNQALRRIFAAIAGARGDNYADRLQAIVVENHNRGRLNWYLRQNEKHTVRGYVQKVMQQYDEEHGYIEALQVEKSHAAWEPLQQKLQGNAYRLLRRWGFTEGQSRNSAADVSQDACIEILFAHFPYDSAFNAWTYQIVHHVCRKHAQQRRTYEKKNSDLDQTRYGNHLQGALIHKLESHLLDSSSPVPTAELAAAIDRLSAIQQQIISEHYILGKPLGDIATETGVARNTIYKRHHDAIKRLRKILESNEHK